MMPMSDLNYFLSFVYFSGKRFYLVELLFKKTVR